MMSVAVTALDVVALLSFAVALAKVAFARIPRAYRVPQQLLAGVLAIGLFVALSNVLEHGSVTSALDPYEDHAETLLVPLFLFAAYSARVVEELDQRRHAEEGLKRAMADLARSEERYRQLVDVSPEAIMVHDPAGLITLANASAAAMFGAASPNDLVGRPIIELIHPEERPRMMATADRLRESGPGGGSARMEVRARRLDGTPMDLEVSGATVGTDGALDDRFKAQMILRDITERKRMEQLKGDFLSMVSHELRTPLTAIVGYGEVLRRMGEEEAPEAYRHSLSRLLQRTEDMRRLVEDLLNVSRIESGELVLDVVRADLARLVRACVEAQPARPELRLAVDIEPDFPSVECDATRLGYAISNLLSNASKFSPEGGTVRVDVTRSADRVRIAVTDTGIGIPPERISEVFDRFSQADMSSTREYGGFGLGLFIARRVIEAHHGTIAVRSEAGKGSTFTIEIPLIQPSPVRVSPQAGVADEAVEPADA